MSLPPIYYIDGHSATNTNTRQELRPCALNLRNVWSLRENQYVIFPVRCGLYAKGYMGDDQLQRLFRNKRRTLRWANGLYKPSRNFLFRYEPILYKPGQHPPNPMISTRDGNVSTLGMWKFGKKTEIYPSGVNRTEYRFHNHREIGVNKRLSEFIGTKPGIFFVGVCRGPLGHERRIAPLATRNVVARIRANESRHKKQLITKRKFLHIYK